MRRTLLGAAWLALSASAFGQAPTLAEVKAKDARQLSTDELKQLLPGAKVVSRISTGSTRSWENKADGTLTASTDNRGNPQIHGSTVGNGTWRLDDRGTYCVTINWPRLEEKWCRYVFKAADKYYAVNRLDDAAPTSELEFSK